MDMTSASKILALLLNVQDTHNPESAPVFSGLVNFDKMFGPFQPGTLSVFGNRPSCGSGELLLSLATKLAFEQDLPCLYVSIRNNERAVDLRIAQAQLGIDYLELRNIEHEQSINAHHTVLEKSPLEVIEKRSFTPDEILSAVENLFSSKTRFSCVFFDGAEMLIEHWNSFLGEAAAAFALSFFKAIAIKHQVPVLVTLGLKNGEQYYERYRPTLSDFEHPREVLRFADKVFIVDRREFYSNSPADKGLMQLWPIMGDSGRVGTIMRINTRTGRVEGMSE
ncbi:DnaB-like helicase C-terminal domain-containing protein [Zhongshania marina]|uniref:SF4 helicase domain-containing protein n=1 Tax=Zhongshania marina TaxID=2304603 RepID=A0ABX9VZ87_9GAMM|nr:hypothetical protein D0911_15185 [Zhongshania marina]